MKAINIEVILIVHQKQALDNVTGQTDSLSNATENPYEFIKVGFIDALEYNYPRVEGIVKNSLRKVELEDKELEAISKIPSNSNDLIVITVVKKLGAYVIAVTEKSPKKFRGVFINRMQNYCLDTLEFLLEANFIRIDSLTNKTKWEELQKEAIVKLKLLGYVAMVAENSGCILNRQYKQISMQLAEAINLIVAWKKSDDERWRKH